MGLVWIIVEDMEVITVSVRLKSPHLKPVAVKE
jgi:hypothetical protein